VFWLCEELQILFADSHEEFDTILNKNTTKEASHRFIIFPWKFLFLLDKNSDKKEHKYEMKRTKNVLVHTVY
jgi:hypothetical protein